MANRQFSGTAMKKRYKIRHQILEQLFSSAVTEKNPQLPKLRTSNVEIAKLTGIPIHDIDTYHELLHEEGEVDCCFDQKGLHEMLITSKGRQSFIDKKFLKEGRKEFWDGLYDPLKIILPVISILVAAVALYLNSLSASRVDNLKSQVEELSLQLDSLTGTTTSR